MKKSLIIVIVVMLLALIAAAIVINSFNKPIDIPQTMFPARLYGYTVNGVPVLQDTEGRYWEAPGASEKIHQEDNILIEVGDENITHVWIEISN